jgi:hypothetical protein
MRTRFPQATLDAMLWSRRMEEPELRDSEELRFHLGCYSLNAFLPTRGMLALTNERLIYRPSFLRIWPRWSLPGWIEVELAAISVVDRRVSRARLVIGSLYPGFPRFRVCLTSGRVYYFQLAADTAYIEKIGAAVAASPRPSRA